MELSSTLDLVMGKVVSFLEHEAFLLNGVGNEIEEIKLELNAMKSFLEDADRKSGVAPNNKTENDWVASVRDVVYEVEDIVDEFMYHRNKQRPWRGKWSGFFLKLIHFPKNQLVNHRVAVNLQDINRKIKSIADRSYRYNVCRLDSEKENKKIGGEILPSDYYHNWLKNLSESSLFLEDDDLVGIDKTQRRLLGWLMDDQDRQRTVISVVGMGGLGKTTLVANTFNKRIVKQHFECCAWITVSKQYVVEELFKSMIRELYDKAKGKTNPVINLDSMSYRDLVGTLVEFLQPKRYLIVLDDVWSTNFWTDINTALPKNMNGSRILLTTRMQDISSFEFGVPRHSLPLKPLTADESWTLFCMKAFGSKLGRCPTHLEPLARNLAAKCEGLPLAIVALGGLMASKKFPEEWHGIYDNLNWELTKNDQLERLKYISLLSYHGLPYRLKHCFLYCCIFPENYVIKRKRLIRLWMAEGFVEPLKETTPEVVAESYLTELICRGLLQVVRRNGAGKPKAFKMHDILRELALSISKSEKFVAKSDGKEVEDNGIRRLSIEAKEKEMKAAGEFVTSRLRSLFIFAVDEISKSNFNRLPSGLKLLRVLDLEDIPISEIPGELVNLFNLRYLNLTRTQVKKLPESIGKLQNLQSLVIKDTQVKELPPGIVKLKNLRHLIAYRYNEDPMEFDYAFGTWVPSNICSLVNLQILGFVEARGSFIKQLSKMTQMKRLSIANIKEADEKNLCFAIAKMRYLHYLLVKSCNEDEQLKMDALESAPPCLDKLVLAGKLEKVPHWLNSARSLSCLHLHWSRLRHDFLPHIQALPNLGEISLVNAYEGERLDFLEGFQKLKILRILKCPRLKEIVMNKEVMPGLQELQTIDCQDFMTLPHGWESLPNLKQVRLQAISPGVIEKTFGPKIVMNKGVMPGLLGKAIAIMLSREEGGEAAFNVNWWY